MAGAGAAHAGVATVERKRTLVAVFQRGAADGLNMVVPHGEKAYYDLRPTIAIPRPTRDSRRRDNAALDLDGFFGLHPALGPLKPLFDQGHLAIVHAVGSPHPTRSHLDAQDYMSRALHVPERAGAEMAFADIGGWDHHVNEPGALDRRLREFGQTLSAFWKDMGDRMNDVVVVTMSEFGRTARENGHRGTDHGHGNCMFVMGGGVKGGKVYGRWPGLESEQLYQGRDLAVTTDIRDVLGELVSRHLGDPSLGTVFPGYDHRPLGLV
jgi:uncharacterized protein (DUF1501 family)